MKEAIVSMARILTLSALQHTTVLEHWELAPIEGMLVSSWLSQS